VILSAKSLLQGWIDSNSEKKGIIDATETSYMDDMIAWRWIQHFERQTKYNKKGDYRLLIYDGYQSHMTWESMNFCEKKKIIVFFLIPYISYLMQPLNVSIFHTYKYWHSESALEAAPTGQE